MDKPYRYREKYGRRMLTVLSVIFAICLFIPSVSAKYQYSYKAKSRIVTSDAFYFAVNLIGDRKMVSEVSQSPEEGYQFQDKEEKTWHLYGGSEHIIPIQLRNYYDALRITQTEISYRATLSLEDSDGKELVTSLASVRRENEEEVQTDERVVQGVIGGARADGVTYGMKAENLILNIEQYANENYKDGTIVKLVIESTEPYKKTMELNFVLHYIDTYLSYEIKDSSGNPYAELIMKNTLSADVSAEGQVIQPYLRWSEELAIDNTNPLTYTYNSENGESSGFVQQKIESQGQMRIMQISKPMKTNECSSIYFFKSDIEQDYTKETTIVHPSSDGKFEIMVSEHNLGTRLDDTSQVNGGEVNMYLPQQKVEISPGRQYSKISDSDSNHVSITGQSAFTLEFITQYVPGQYSSVKERLQTSFHELYLWDGKDIAFTATVTEGNSNSIKLQSIVKGNSPQSTEGYEIHRDSTEDSGDTYYITKSNTEIEMDTNVYATSEVESTFGKEKLILVSAASSDFKIPVGTIITMVAQINNYAPTYWYYYCTEEKKELILSDFCQMNTEVGDISNKYSLYMASGNRVREDAKEIVTENLRFIFDFSNIKEESVMLQGQSVQLKHIATVDGIENVEIMDYVEQSVMANSNENAFYRSFPKMGNVWNISKNNTNIESFHMNMTDANREYSVHDTYEMRVEIGENVEHSGTREREYAVKLERIETDENGNARMDSVGNMITGTFPEGMTIMYNDQELIASENNRAFILPVKSAGTHIFQIRTGLSAFHSGEDGTIMLRASLYASKDASHYNDLNLGKTAFASFKVKAEPEYALAICNADGEQEKERLFGKGENISLGIRALKDGTVEQGDRASVTIYRLDKEKQNYTRMEWSALFEGEENAVIELTGDLVTWTGHISERAMTGVYRLEFCYHDKIEYMDLIVK